MLHDYWLRKQLLFVELCIVQTKMFVWSITTSILSMFESQSCKQKKVGKWERVKEKPLWDCKWKTIKLGFVLSKTD